MRGTVEQWCVYQAAIKANSTQATLTTPGRVVLSSLYLNLCATDSLSRVVRSSQVLSYPVISRPALPACYMLCLHANWIRRLTCQVLAIVIHATFPFR